MPVRKLDCMSELSKGKLYFHGTDKEGHPLAVFSVKKHLPKERSIEEMGKMVVFWMEVAEKIYPADKSKFTVLIDRSGFKQENSDIEFVKSFGKTLQVGWRLMLRLRFRSMGLMIFVWFPSRNYFQDNYPERIYRIIVYPSGIVFYGIWNVVKWFLDPVTQVPESVEFSAIKFIFSYAEILQAKVQPMLQLAGVQQFIEDEFIPAEMVRVTSSFAFQCGHFLLTNVIIDLRASDAV